MAAKGPPESQKSGEGFIQRAARAMQRHGDLPKSIDPASFERTQRKRFPADDFPFDDPEDKRKFLNLLLGERAELFNKFGGREWFDRNARPGGFGERLQRGGSTFDNQEDSDRQRPIRGGVRGPETIGPPPNSRNMSGSSTPTGPIGGGLKAPPATPPAPIGGGLQSPQLSPPAPIGGGFTAPALQPPTPIGGGFLQGGMKRPRAIGGGFQQGPTSRGPYT